MYASGEAMKTGVRRAIHLLWTSINFDSFSGKPFLSRLISLNRSQKWTVAITFKIVVTGYGTVLATTNYFKKQKYLKGLFTSAFHEQCL